MVIQKSNDGIEKLVDNTQIVSNYGTEQWTVLQVLIWLYLAQTENRTRISDKVPKSNLSLESISPSIIWRKPYFSQIYIILI